MCGIAGILKLGHSAFGKEQLLNMTSALAHRGPDGERTWASSSEQIFFGHRHLSIIDLSPAAHQPMHFADRYTIIHNGEVYNYIEIKETLEKSGYTFRSHSDTEVILAAYDKWGTECLDHFDGMFAFAIWDEIEHQLFIARDRFGEKPLFYYQDNNNFVFASEMKAIWAAGIVREPNRRMLFNFLTIGYTENPEQPGETFFENIFKLPAASFLLLKIGEAPRIENYWDIDPENQDKKIKDADAVHKFQELLKRSVHRRLRSDVPIGSSLSGGLDSSSIVSLLMKDNSLDYPPRMFTAIFPGFEKDEEKYAREVSKIYDLPHTLVEINEDDLLSNWNEFSSQQEEPVGSAGVYAQYCVYKAAQEAGVKVLLDGQGADETLAGYSRYYKWHWQELFRRGKLSRSKEVKAAQAMGVQEHFGINNMIAAFLPDFASVVLERQYLLKALKQQDLHRDFVKMQSKEAYYTTPDVFTLNGALHFNTFTHGLEELLRYADRNAGAHGREIRLPFLSHELVEFVFSLPAHFKIRGGWTKWILRESMKDSLPHSIVWRAEKVGFEAPQKKWMGSKGMEEGVREARKTLVDQMVLDKSVLSGPILPSNSYDANNLDWRYFSAASLFK